MDSLLAQQVCVLSTMVIAIFLIWFMGGKDQKGPGHCCYCNLVLGTTPHMVIVVYKTIYCGSSFFQVKIIPIKKYSNKNIFYLPWNENTLYMI